MPVARSEDGPQVVVPKPVGNAVVEVINEPDLQGAANRCRSRLAVSTRISQGFFSAYETRWMIGRPIPKSIPAIASPTIGLDGRATPRMSTSVRT